VRPIVDTGPLVALLDAREPDHAWARETFDGLRAPLYTCEACLSEAAFLLGHVKGGPNALLTLVSRGIIVPQFRLSSEIEAIRKLMTKYASVPMSLADACASGCFIIAWRCFQSSAVHSLSPNSFVRSGFSWTMYAPLISSFRKD
jgi:predicted nucleic acid-binding protein